MDRKKRPFTVGFGGYGRLGHAEQKDEMIPRLIKFFDGNNRGVTQVYCGSAYTMAVNEIGELWQMSPRECSARIVLQRRELL